MKKQKSWYTILIVLFVVGFLLVLTSGVFKLVLQELNDNRGRGDYLKAYYWAESWIEWALYNIKKFDYGYSDEIDLEKNNKSILLSANPLSEVLFNPKKDVLTSYSIDTKVNTYTQTLASWEHTLFPLYVIYENGVTKKALNIELTIPSGSKPSLVWNIIGGEYGLAWNNEFEITTLGAYKTIDSSGNLKFERKQIWEFLTTSDNNYLLLFNSDPTNSLTYKVSSTGNNFFTKPIWEIEASWKIGSYKQNIRLSLNNSEYLNILKYSIFSN